MNSVRHQCSTSAATSERSSCTSTTYRSRASSRRVLVLARTCASTPVSTGESSTANRVAVAVYPAVSEGDYEILDAELAAGRLRAGRGWAGRPAAAQTARISRMIRMMTMIVPRPMTIRSRFPRIRRELDRRRTPRRGRWRGRCPRWRAPRPTGLAPERAPRPVRGAPPRVHVVTVELQPLPRSLDPCDAHAVDRERGTGHLEVNHQRAFGAVALLDRRRQCCPR